MECLICFGILDKESINFCFNTECKKPICDVCLHQLKFRKYQKWITKICPFCTQPFNSTITILKGGDIYKVLGIDTRNKLMKLQPVNDEKKMLYKRFTSSIMWADDPPNCNKCDMPNNQVQCPSECYGFQTNYNTNTDAIMEYGGFTSEDNTEKIKF